MSTYDPIQWINFIDYTIGIKETAVLEGLDLTGLEDAIHKSDSDEMRETTKKFPSLIPIILTCI